MKKKISLILTLVLILSTVFAVNVFALDVANIKEGTYIIQSKLGSNMVLDVYDASKESGANVQLYKKNNTSAQVFEIKKSGDYYTITPKCSGLKLDVKGGLTESGANVWQYESNNSDSQKWRFYSAGNGYYYIRCKIGDKALDVAGGKSTNGTNIQMYTLNQSNAQKWKLVQVTSSKKAVETKLTWQWPMNDYKTNQGWAVKNTKRGGYHAAVDIDHKDKKDADKNIYAAANGTVVYKGYTNGNGYHIVLSHKVGNETVKTLYSHLSSYSSCPKVGKKVSKGDKIGVIGSSGNSTGVHLHFAIYKGSSSDPFGYYTSKSNNNKGTRNGITYYNPAYVIKYNKLP